MFKHFRISFYAIFLFAVLAFGDSNSNVSIEQLKLISQELLDAVASGNKAVWDKYLAHDCLYVDEDGGISTKTELLKNFNPLPPGYSGHILVGDSQARFYEDTAILTHRDHETLELFGQKLETTFQTTTTFLRRNGEWEIVFVHVSVLPSELKPVRVDPKILDRYVGRYEIASETYYIVTREDARLFGQRNGRAKEELFPSSETTFFRRGNPRSIRVFVSDDQGKVIRMIDRRDNNDLIWTKK